MAVPNSDKIEFDNPPLIEVVCGLQFQMVPSFTVGHVGKLWSLYDSTYEESREQPALVSPVEIMPGEALTQQLIPTLMPRTIFAAKDKSAVIQIQRDAFYYNWQGPSGEYPRYEKVIGNFERDFSTFTSFLSKHELGTVNPIQFELTYLNEIPVPSEGRVLRDSYWDTSQRFLPAPDSVNLNASFLLQDGLLGRLHSNFRNVQKDNCQVYHWSLVVRGCTNPRRDMSIDRMRDWFDNARSYINHGFADLADLDFQAKQWGRKK